MGRHRSPVSGGSVLQSDDTFRQAKFRVVVRSQSFPHSSTRRHCRWFRSCVWQMCCTVTCNIGFMHIQSLWFLTLQSTSTSVKKIQILGPSVGIWILEYCTTHYIIQGRKHRTRSTTVTMVLYTRGCKWLRKNVDMYWSSTVEDDR